MTKEELFERYTNLISTIYAILLVNEQYLYDIKRELAVAEIIDDNTRKLIKDYEDCMIIYCRFKKVLEDCNEWKDYLSWKKERDKEQEKGGEECKKG